VFFVVGKQAFQIPGALDRKCATRQSRLGGSLLARIGVRFRENYERVIVQRAAFQQLAQFASLLQDRSLPRTRPTVWLLFPFQKVREQGDQTAGHLPPISFGHVRQVLAKVCVIHFGVPAFRRQVRHDFKPGRLVSFK